MSRQAKLPDDGIFRADILGELRHTLAVLRACMDQLYVLESHLEDATRED